MALNVTQPALSKTLARLRRYFDDPLFVRVALAHGADAEGAGTAGADRAILERHARVAQRARSVRSRRHRRRTFNFCVVDAGVIKLLPKLVNQHRRGSAACAAARAASRGRASGIVAGLRQGRFRDGLVSRTDQRQSAGNRCGSREYVSVVRKGHPRIGASRRCAAFAAEKHVLVSTVGTGHAHHLAERAIEAAVPEENIICRVPMFIGAAVLAKHTDVIATLPLVDRDRARPDLDLDDHHAADQIAKNRNLSSTGTTGCIASPGTKWICGLFHKLFKETIRRDETMVGLLTEEQVMLRDTAETLASALRPRTTCANSIASGFIRTSFTTPGSRPDCSACRSRRSMAGSAAASSISHHRGRAFARRAPIFSMAFGGSMFCGLNVLRMGTEEQKRHWLPKLLTGEIKMSISMSEPDAGSDIGAMRTHARRDGDRLCHQRPEDLGDRRRREEQFHQRVCEDRSEGALPPGHVAVPGRQRHAGLEVRKLDMLGRRCVGTYEIFLQRRARAGGSPDRRREQWLGLILSGLQAERVFAAACDCGSARGVFEMALRYANERKQFGRAIGTFQAIAHMLADMQTEIEAAWALTLRAAAMVDQPARMRCARSPWPSCWHPRPT